MLKLLTQEEAKDAGTIEPDSLIHGDCLEVMKYIADKSIDCILCDPPYQITACKWDSMIPLDPMWEQLKRIIKPVGAIIMTASQPFTTKLISSNMGMFKYELVWNKCAGGAFVLAKKRVLPSHENILIFSYRNKYNPQMSIKPLKNRKRKVKETNFKNTINNCRMAYSSDYNESLTYPVSILSYPKNTAECNTSKRVHPTQKPVALMEYLIKTYTDEGDIVLDFCAGSGTTCCAARLTNRKFIGIELNKAYYDKAYKRIKHTPYQQPLEL